MFSVLLLSASDHRCQYVKAVLSEGDRLAVIQDVNRIPAGYDMLRLLTTVEPDVTILDMQDVEPALECAGQIRERFPEIPIIGMSDCNLDIPVGRDAPISVLVPFPSTLEVLAEAVEEAFHYVVSEVEEKLLAFLPAKAGSGASTVVLNTAVAFAASTKKKVLVLEADLRSGVLAVMLNTQPPPSIQQLLRASADLEPSRVRAAVHTLYGVDWLLSDRSLSGYRPNWDDYFRLLEQVRSKYDLIIADLPELVNPATREIVRRAKWVFNICTPEVLPLRLAEQRFRELAMWGVPEDRVRVLLNRWAKNEISAADVAEHLDRPVLHVFSNDYRSIRGATIDGRPIAQDTALWREYVRFAQKLGGAEDEKPLHSKLLGLFR